MLTLEKPPSRFVSLRVFSSKTIPDRLFLSLQAARADLIGRRDFLLNRPKGLGLLSTGSYWVLNSFSESSSSLFDAS